MQAYRDGETRDIGGVQYVRQGGEWHPQSAGGPVQPIFQAPAEHPPSGYRARPGGGLEPIPGGPADPTRPGGPNDPSGNEVATPGNLALEGNAYLQSLPQSLQSQVRALSEGRLAMPTGRAATSDYWQRIMQATGHYDPTFDAANYQTRVQTRRSFTSGRDRQNITALNTALGHLETLSQAGTALDNGSWPLINTVRNMGRSWSGDPRIVTFNEARQAVVDEMERAFRGTSGTEGGIEHWRESINAAQSPEQLHAAVQQAVTLLGSRLDSLGDAYNQGMGRSDDPMTLLNPHARQVMQTFGAGTPYGGPEGTAPPTLGVPPAAPPGPSGPTGGERLDATTPTMGARGADTPVLNTGATQSVADPALAGINAHVAAMLQNRSIPDAQIRSYIQERGIPLEQVPSLNAVFQFRQQHPGYSGGYDVQLDQHTLPQSMTRQALTNIGDSAAGAYTVAAGNMVAGQQLPSLVGALGGDSELASAGIDEIRNRHPLASVAGDVSGGALAYGVGGRVAQAGEAALERAAPSLYSRLPAWIAGGERATGTLAPRAIAGDAALGSYESPENRTEGALIGAGTGAAVRGAFNTVGRAVSPTGGALAPAYEEGVQPTLGQRMGGAANRVEQAFQSVPIVGGIQRGARTAAQDQWQLGGFNRALRNLPDEVQLPAGTDPGTAPHAFAQDAFDKAYDRVHQRVRVVDDDQLQQDLTDIRQNATTLSDPSISHFNRILDNSVIRRLENSGGELSGPDLQQALSEVRRTARSLRSNPTGDRELAAALDDVSQVIHDNAVRHSPAEAISTLNKVNRGYAMLTRIENAANRGGAGEAGEYTPRGLLNAERQQGGLRGRSYSSGHGLMTNYAEAGMKLGQTVGDSGTGERLLATGGAIGMGALPHFAGTAGIVPAALYGIDTLATMPGARKAVDWALRPNRASIRPFTDELRDQIQSRAYLGSAIGLPAISAAYGGK